MRRGHRVLVLVAPLLCSCGLGSESTGFAPIVTITSPNTTIVRGIVNFTAEVATSTGEVSLVQFYVDNTFLFAKDKAPFSGTWDTSTVPDGQHVIRVQAFDPDGFMGTAQKTVQVSNLPPI